MLLSVQPAAAAAGAVAIEIDARADPLIDARVTRRLVQLELADVTVPPALGQRDVALFVRVLLAQNGELAVELWERGVAYGARNVAVSGAGSLLARRLALAAAELARELADTREDEAREREAARQKRLLAARLRRERTLDGPRALRVGALAVLGKDLALVGPELAAELHAARALRFDLTTSLGIGTAGARTPAESLSLGLGPARRVTLGTRWDLDLGLSATAGVVDLWKTLSVDGIAGEHQTWLATVDGHLRLEPRLARGVRIFVGLGGGVVLRRAPFAAADGTTESIRGVLGRAEIGVVLTPP